MKFHTNTLIAALSVPTLLATPATLAQNTSPPAILQWFDSEYATQQERLADFFLAGYGATWIPPVGKADTGGLSVGYDVLDRFDLGAPNARTLYGTEAGLRGLTAQMRRLGGATIVDLVWNHNGFADASTPGFIAGGGYPGFVLTHPDAVDGDFHGRFEEGDLNFRLSGLIDIKHETNFQYIRTPTTPGDPRNIPAGTFFNRPDPANERFYADRDAQPIFLFNPLTGEQNIAVYPFASAANGSGDGVGDAVPENALGLLMRNARWLVQDVGVDGYRLDAARHFEPWVFSFFDQAVYRASTRTNLDGSPYHVYSFSEGAETDRNTLLARYVRKDINNADPGRIAGNRDALDFAQFWGVHDNLTSNGAANDWRNLVNAGMDVFDDGLVNGSSGVVFVESHDDFGPAMINVAYAFSMLRPAQAIVYYNAEEHYNPLRDFPKDGRGNALGNFGDEITELVDLRNRYGRGDYRERWLEKENYAYERSKSALVLLSNRNDAGFDSRTLGVDFEPGTWLVELTGNAERYNEDTNTLDIPQFVQVQGTPGTPGSAFVNARFLRNDGKDRGYLIYGVPTPQSSGGVELVGAGVGPVLAGDTPPTFVGGETEEEIGQIVVANAKARLADYHVIHGDSFTVRLATQAVTLDVPGLAGGVRDIHADGDHAMIRINSGIDLNGNGFVDETNPSSVAYGFEDFVTTYDPGFFNADGNGLYEQLVDTTLLPEGVNFLTVRAFRHRNTATGGDGGPAVFSDFKRVLYVDRLLPEAEVAGFTPFDSTGENLDFQLRSLDGTAEEMFVFLNLGAAVDEATILTLANDPNNAANRVDTGLFQRGYFNVLAGTNFLTVVTREITGTTNVQRLAVEVDNGNGAGFGDLNGDGRFTGGDLANAPNNFESFLYSRDALFSPAADGNGDGLVDTRDLLLLEDVFTFTGQQPAVLNLLNTVVRRRADLNGSGTTTSADVDALRAQIANPTDLWLVDLNVDGVVSEADVDFMLTQMLKTSRADVNLDGTVDLFGDFSPALASLGAAGFRGFGEGDVSGDGFVSILDDISVILAALPSGDGAGGDAALAGATATYDPATGLITISAHVAALVAVTSAGDRLIAGTQTAGLGDAATTDFPDLGEAAWLAAGALLGGQTPGDDTLTVQAVAGTPLSDLTLLYQVAGGPLTAGAIQLIPEPAAAALLALGGLALRRRRVRGPGTVHR